MIKNINISSIDSFLSFLKYQKRASEHTVRSYLTDIFQFYDFLIEENQPNAILLEQVKRDHIRAWIIALVELKLDPRSINRKIASLRSFYKFLCKEEVIEKNPANSIQSLKVKKTIPNFVEEDKMESLITEIEFPQNFQGIRDKLIIELLYGTGIRLAELIGLKNNDINLVNYTIKVLGKRNKERIIPIPSELIKVIKLYNQVKKNELGELGIYLIVTNKGKPAYAQLIQRIVKKYLKLVTTIEKKSPHVLRHTFATHLLNNGADLNAIKDLLGHANLAATQIYTHNSLKKLKAIFDQAHPKA